VERRLDAGFIRPCRYAEWVSNIVPVEKKNTGKILVCIDFHNLTKATHKDEYPMPIADMLINNASGHRVICFLDGNAGYNQIFMAEEDMLKTAFRCPGFIGLFESDSMDGHLADLRLSLKRMRRYGLKMNALKRAFGVWASKFLGFIIHEHGIEIDPTKIESINKVRPRQCKNDMQKFLGKVNYVR
jgi:hypothetical protein